MIDCKREGTVFENHPKSLISKNCERILSGLKLIKLPTMVNLVSIWKTEACGQTMLPDRSIKKDQKLIKLRHLDW
jgi:hypothetical protein